MHSARRSAPCHNGQIDFDVLERGEAGHHTAWSAGYLSSASCAITCVGIGMVWYGTVQERGARSVEECWIVVRWDIWKA